MEYKVHNIGVINLSPEICIKIKNARREKGLSQSLLAKEVGCKQSALSMFEQGDGTKLNDDVIKKLCLKFGIELPEVASKDDPLPQRPLIPANTLVRGFCPNASCPSHTSYEVDGRKFLRPDRNVQDPVGGKYCAVCGEIIEKVCPNCFAPVHDGAVCSICGESYVAIFQ